MPAGRTKFQDAWLEKKDSNNDVVGSWCSKGRNDYEAYCLHCKSNFSISNSGLSQILQHTATVKHRTVTKQLKGQTNLSFFKGGKEGHTSFPLSNECNPSQLATRAEALWAIKTAVSNFSFLSCKDIVPVFQAMFPENSTANNMKLSERKVSYVIAHGLGPFFTDETLSDIKAAVSCGNYFTICFDETTTNQVKKQLDISARYWSPKQNKVTSRYLTSLFFGHATANDISSGILNYLDERKLPLTKLLMLSMDGPYVNHAIMRKINEHLSISGSQNLLNIGSCNLHKVHNCFSKALVDFPLDVDELCTDLFSFFKFSAARREDFSDIETLVECERKIFLRHVSSRWLTLGPVISRILSIYSAVKEYFLNFLPKQNGWSSLQKNARYKRIVTSLNDPNTIIYLEFLGSFTPSIESFLKKFQGEEPLIHLLFSEMNSLLRAILIRFIKPEVIGNCEGKKLISIDIEKFENYRPLQEIEVGEAARKALSNLKEKAAKEARMAIRAFLLKFSKLFIKALPLSDPFLRDLEKLHPLMRTNLKHENAIRRLCINMKPLKLDDNSIDKIMAEWRLYNIDPQVDEIFKDCDINVPIDHFWSKVFNLKEKVSGLDKYVNLALLVKNCLAISHGNADVERGFSLNQGILSDKRTQLSEATIIGIRHIKDTVKIYGGDVCAVPISGKLLNYVSKSHSTYMAAKEMEKKAVQDKIRKRALEEEDEQKNKETKKLKCNTEKSIKDLDKKINNLQSDLTAAQQCLMEANERLQAAVLKTKKIEDIKISSTIIDAATKKIKDINSQLTELQNKKFKLKNSLK